MATQTKLSLISACGIALLLFISVSLARSDEKSISYSLVPPPSCLNNLGENVVFENINNGQAEVAAAMAKRDKRGNPVVYRFNYKYSPQPLQHFIDLHECAHHQTGDVDLPHPPRNSPDHMMNESIADCIATLRIRDEIGTGRDVVLQAVQQLVEDMVKIGFSATTTYSRKSDILNCLEKDEFAQAFIDRILRHRELR